MNMKRLSTVLLAATALCATVSAQTQIMTVTKTDGTKTVFTMNDVERVNFDELSPAESFESGDGTTASPYAIANIGQLMLMAEKVNSGDSAYIKASYELTSDIDLMGIEWTPIGNGKGNTSIDLAEKGAFLGVFNGNGHTISNLCINATATEYVSMYGLFGFVGIQSEVKDLKVTGCVKATSSVSSDTEKTTLALGGIAGVGSYTTFTNCSFEGTVVGTYLAAESSVMVGGLVGHMVGTLNKCSATIAKGDSVCGTATYSNVARWQDTSVQDR